jgi:ElaB/YqjD/DUF883 family membrane-anchored ribosome-binding protein
MCIRDSFGSVRDFAKVIADKVSDFTRGAAVGLIKAAKIISTGFVKFAKFGIEFLSGFISAVDSLIKAMKPLVDGLADIKGKGLIGFIRGTSEPSKPIDSTFSSTVRSAREFKGIEPTQTKEQLQRSEADSAFEETESSLSKLQKKLDGTKDVLQGTIDNMDGFFNRTIKWVEDFSLVETKADEAGEKMKETMADTNVVLEQTEEDMKAIEDALKRVQGAADKAGDIIAQGFEDAVFKAKTFEEALGSIADQLLKMVFQQTVTQPLSQLISTGLTSFFSPAPSLGAAPTGGANNAVLSQNFSNIAGDGAIMSHGHMDKFARGGVVSRPTKFPMSGGKTGLMGESGEEGILPLRRGRNGVLGVVSSSRGGGTTMVNVNVVDQRKGGAKPEVSEGKDNEGNRQITVLIRDEVKKGFADGAFDRNLKVFGLTRGGIGRV